MAGTAAAAKIHRISDYSLDGARRWSECPGSYKANRTVNMFQLAWPPGRHTASSNGIQGTHTDLGAIHKGRPQNFRDF